MDSVTKTKNEGRVAAGKRLAEWNRKNKEDLLKNKESVPAQVISSEDKTSSRTWQYYSGLGVILLICGVGGGIYYLYNRQKSLAQTPPEPLKKQPKIYME